MGVTARPPAPPPRARAAGGYTFLELVVTMGVIAVVAGLGVGFLQNLGRGSRALQGAEILAEAGYECRNRSLGGRIATLFLEEEADEGDNVRLLVSQAVQRPMLTAHFEEAQWFVNAAGPATATAEGAVSLDPDGKSGSAVSFARGGRLVFGTQAAFAPSDGIEVSVWLRPAPGRGTSVVLRGEEMYELRLVYDGSAGGRGPDAFRVQMRLRLVDADEDPRAGLAGTTSWTTFDTTTASVLAGRWSEVVASFDGVKASLRVNGVEALRPDAAVAGTRPRARPAGAPGAAGAAPQGPPRRRFVVPATGATQLTLSGADQPYVGAADTLFVQGVFRSADDRRQLPDGLSIERPRLPHVVRFRNGRLDPQTHRSDVNVLLVDESDRDGPRWLVRYGLYGLVSQPRLVGAGESVDGAPTTPPAGP